MTQRIAPLWTICARPDWTVPVTATSLPFGISPVWADPVAEFQMFRLAVAYCTVVEGRFPGVGELEDPALLRYWLLNQRTLPCQMHWAMPLVTTSVQSRIVPRGTSPRER